MKTILVLTDFSRRAARAAELALELAAKEKLEVTLFYSCYVLVPLPAEAGNFPYLQEYGELERDNREELTLLSEKLRKKFFARHHRLAPAIHVQTSPGPLGANVRELQHQHDLWMIVMGGKGRESGFERFIFGSETREVIDAADCPVLLIPEGASIEQVGRIGFATELNRSDAKVMPFLGELSRIWKSTLELVHVNGYPEPTPVTRLRNERAISKIVRAADYPDTRVIAIEGENVAHTLGNYARRAHPGILALVHRKRSLFSRALHRSISRQMIEVNRTPVLVLPG